jgi:gamma-glutamyltranspeptidase/glutathione hydrolase
MTIQQACEAANINTNQLWLSLGGSKINDRQPKAGNLLLNTKTKNPAIVAELEKMGYKLSFDDRSSGPINAIWFDWKHGSFWGGSSNNGEDYGIGW